MFNLICEIKEHISIMKTYLIIILLLAVASYSSGQTLPSAPQGKTKTFGSSLEKYKIKPRQQRNAKSSRKNEKAKNDDVIRVKTDLIINDVLVTDQNGTMISDLKKDDFVVTEDGTKYTIETFSRGENAFVPRSFLTAGQTAMFKVAELSGGETVFIEKPEDAEKAYANIFENIKNRYVIGYYSIDEERDEKRRNIKIEVRNHPEYIVTGRRTQLTR